MFNEQLLKYYRIDIQLFARAEDEGRTEDPTERRKKEKRNEGQVARSPELVSSGVFVVVLSVFVFSFQNFISVIFSMMRYYFAHLDNKDIPFSIHYVFVFGTFFWKCLIPVIAAAVISGVVMNILQVGFLITPKAVEPRLSRISFTWGKLREKVFFSRPMVLNMVFAIGRLFFLTTVFIVFIFFSLHNILNLTSMGLESALSFLLNSMMKIFFFCGGFLILIGIPDFYSKKKQFKDSLKMTKSDVKREMRQEDGDPRMKSQMRDMFNRILQKQNIRNRVPKADVVITNPTHFAVALQYQMDSMEFPMVIAKGEDDTALLIRELANQNDIDIIENPPLARELYKLINVGDYIPEHLTLVIAEIFIGLYKKGKWNMSAVGEENIG